MVSSPGTPSSTRRLSEVARRLVVPPSATRTGWPDVESTCRTLGATFDRWQADAGRAILCKTPDGNYAATVGGVGLSWPRQVGKTYLIGFILFALCILFPRLTVIWTSHHSRTTNETMRAMQGMAGRAKIKPHVAKITTGNGDECIHFHNGSRILFGARESGFGRGFAGVDILMFDEAQLLKDKTLDAMLATMNTSRIGLAIMAGTPPTPEDVAGGWHEVFARMRESARSADPEDHADLVWIELGADPGADPDDRKQWAKGNPSYPHRTPLTSMLRLKKKLRPDSWLREGLGIWDEDASALPSWAHRKGPRPEGLPVSALAIAAEVDQRHCTIAAASARDGRVFVRSLQYGAGVGWVVEAVKTHYAQHRVPVVVDKSGPASGLIEALEDAGVDLRIVSTDAACNAAPEFVRLVNDDLLTHAGDAELDVAVGSAVRQPSGDRWRWGRRKSAADISPLEGVTLAAWEALYPEGGQNVFIPSRRHQATLVVGPLADEWAASNDPDATTSPGMAPWERDRFRSSHAARVVVVLDDYTDFRPSKYGKEELVTIGG